ncbi:Fanconi anemia group D2 protein isoform X1 [Macrobrachium rosenbergii]|uniref:Fanconi anemia group D2 protein isoform X1 n=2 Tax=Macrobrachium rosenbergii TaxID=79674 RepID=UPI0034D3F9F8
MDESFYSAEESNAVEGSQRKFNSMSPRKKTKRKLAHVEDESEDLFGSPKKSQKSQKSPARKSKKKGDVEDESLFCELVTKAGYVLKDGDQANLLKCDLAIFKKKLQWSLKSHRFYKMPEIVEVFIKDLENHLEDPLRLKWALLYTQTEAGCESARGGQQDSLIRLCLNIEELQPALIKLLTEKFFEVAYDDQNSNSVDIPCLILANLKWLDYVIDPEVLTTKVIELLEGSPLKIQREVITFVPHIVDDANHPKIATVLCKLYEQKRELTPAVLDTLGDLTLEPESFQDVHHSVLKTLHAVRAEQLPIVTKFLLHNTPQSVAYQVVSDMREKISLPGDYIGSSQRSPKKKNASKNDDDDVAAYEILVFAKIKMAILFHKFLTNAWLKAIQDEDDVASVRPLDFLLLIVVYEAVPTRQRPIESIFRNKIRTRLFSDAMIEKTFVNHKAVLKEYFSSVIKIASLLLRSCEPLINQAAAAIYRSAFVSMDGHQKQEVILSLLGHLGDSSTVRSAVLSTLSSLAHSHTQEMSKYAIFFKSSLDLVSILNMGEIKHLLDVVSHLAYSDGSHAALQDELAILVRKQLSHVELKYKLIGVINAVFCLKNIANADDSHVTNSRSSESELDSSALKEAENLLLLVLSSTAKLSTATALFMDELASIILKEGLNAKLEEWICDRMTNDFQDVYVLDIEQDTQPPDDLLPLGIRWNLEVCEEDRKIALNLAPMVIRLEQTRVDPFDVEGSLVYMTTQFRLLRMLESRLHDGDLSNIDALLGCPIYAPSEEVYDKFDSLSPKEQHAALSCLFYVANWFRELLNAFVTQKDKDCKVKVYSRLRQLIEIEKVIWQKLPKCHSYTPPLAVYDVDTSMLPPLLNFAAKKKGKRGRKPTVGKGKKGKGKVKENTEATQIGTQPNSQSITQLKTQQSQPVQDEETDVSSKETFEVDRSSCRPFLRELHIDVFALMFRKLGIDTSSQSGTQLTPAELEFLLTDLNSKLSHIFASGSKRTPVPGHGEHRNIGFSHIDLFNPAEIAQRVLTYFKPICHHLETISGFFQSLIAENDGVMDVPVMYSDHTQPLIVANSLLFTTLAIFFSWPGLQKEENENILINALRAVGKRLEGDTVNSMEQEGLTSVAFRYLSNFQGSIINLETARTLVQCLVNFLSFPCSENLSEKLVEVVEELLKREWYTKGGESEKGAAYNQHIYSLLEVYFKNSGTTISYVDTLCSVGLAEFLEDTGRNPQSETFPTLNKGTLGIFYRSMMSFLVTGTKKSLSSLGSASLTDKEKCLETWSTAIKIFHVLVTMLKTHDSKTLLCPCLKYSRSFLELFLRSAMPVLDSCLLVHNQEVTVLLKNLQGSTRLLQHVCTHSKVTQDTSLTRYVPLLKKSLEMLVYRVKAMLVLNKCSEAFWMGNLKNRDLKGEILSQSIREESEAEDGEEEEVEEEDHQSDVELDEEEDPKPIVEGATSSSNYSVSF